MPELAIGSEDALIVLGIKQQQEPRALDGAGGDDDHVAVHVQSVATGAPCRDARNPSVVGHLERRHGRVQPDLDQPIVDIVMEHVGDIA